MKFFLVITIISTLLTGCSFLQKKCVDVNINKDKEKLLLQELPALKLDKVEFKTINEKNSSKVFSDLKELNIDPAIMGLTDTYYENNGLNFSKLYIRIYELNEQLRKYREYYEPINPNMDDDGNE